MQRDELLYTIESAKPFTELIAALEKEASDRKFRVLHKHDIQATLNEKGFTMTPYTVIEVCNGKFAHDILMKEKEVGMMLPCRIAVYTEGDANRVVMMKPSAMNPMMPDAGLGSIPQEVEDILIEAVKAAV